MGENKTSRGLKRQYSKQDIDARRVWGGTPDICFSFLLSHLNKGFHLESPFSGSWRQSCRHMAMDGWMRQSDEHGGMRRTAWDEGGSHSSLASHSCLSLGEPCSPCGWGHPVPIQKWGEPPASAQRDKPGEPLLREGPPWERH